MTVSRHDGEVRPLPGMVPVGEYSNRWDAQIAVARLGQAGIEAVLLADPAEQVAPHHVTERVILVVVREEAAADAGDVLAADRVDEWTERMDAEFFSRRFADRPRWIRWSTLALIVAIPLPFALTATYLSYRFVAGLFP